jgi:phage baseplate assembly protein W
MSTSAELTMSDSKAFLGVGWAFPVATDATGAIAEAAYEIDIEQSVRIILGTEPGERVMRPDFGAGLRGMVFEPINTTTIALVQYRVQQALIQWEPRIDSVNVVVGFDPPNGRLRIDVSYRIRTTNTFYNLVYPFYVREGQA